MKYEEFVPSGVPCTVVCGGKAQDRDRFTAQFLRKHPEFRVQEIPELMREKKRFLQKDKSVIEILTQDVKKSDRVWFESALEKEGKRMSVQGQLLRPSRALSNGQKLFWTRMRDTVMGKQCFLIQDDGEKPSVQGAAKFLCWLGKYVKNAQAIWVTGCPMDACFHLIYPEDLSEHWNGEEDIRIALEDMTLFKTANEFCELKDGELYRHDEKWKAAQILRAEQEAEPLLERAKELEDRHKYESAMEIYEQLIAKDSVKARVAAADLYHKINLGKWENQWRLNRAKKLCEAAARHDSADAYILLGNWEMNVFKRIPEGQTGRLEAIERARDYYFAASNLDSVMGCYLSAKLCLQYTAVRKTEYGFITKTVLEENMAVTHIQRLMELNRAGDKTAWNKIMELKAMDNEIYEKAGEEYFRRAAAKLQNEANQIK